jgi:glyoxylase-like metal-dependent hydrolase (beta-lactamase superfamily II)
MLDPPCANPKIYRFRLGSFEIASLLDAVDHRNGLGSSFALDQSASVVQKLADDNYVDAHKYVHCFIPILVDTGAARILFDTGLGRPEGSLLTCIAALGIGPNDIDIVVLTHGHPDHIGGLRQDGKLVFPKASHMFSGKEFTFWMDGLEIPEARRETRDFFVSTCAELAGHAVFLEPGQQVVPSITAIDAAGHSPGMLAFIVESNEQKMLIWADAFLHYVLSIQHPEWHAAFDHDRQQAVKTRMRLLQMAVEQRMLVAGFHMPFPGLGYIQAAQNSFRWLPVSYQLSRVRS